jgi:hypothetical protein
MSGQNWCVGGGDLKHHTCNWAWPKINYQKDQSGSSRTFKINPNILKPQYTCNQTCRRGVLFEIFLVNAFSLKNHNATFGL